MAQEGNWATFEDDEEEALSLSDLPVIDPDEDTTPDGGTRRQEAEEFEFQTSGGGFLLKTGETDMCSADEVFFQGQILPLRPSVSSDSDAFHVLRDLSRCVSRSESMDRYYSSMKWSSGFNSARSFSGRSISRSHSSSSCSSAYEAPRRSISNKFYAHPSPKPHICSRRKQNTARKSTNSTGLFRLGLVKTPEIELQDLRLRGASGFHCSNSNRINRGIVDEIELAKANKGREQNRGKIEVKGHEINSTESSRDVNYKPQKKALRFLARGFHCRCSPDDAVDSISFKQGRKKDELGLKGEEVLCHFRTHMWLDELSTAKPPVVRF